MKILSLLIVAFLAGCAHSNSGKIYTRDQARVEEAVKMGTVESVREVEIEGTKSPVGATVGTVVGGVAGSDAGQGKGSAVASVIGAVVGGIGGSALEEAITRKPGIEIVVKLDSGESIAIVQEADETFKAGEKVRIISHGGTSRVSH